MKYQIENVETGEILGVYEADTGNEAIAAMMADAGHDGEPADDVIAFIPVVDGEAGLGDLEALGAERPEWVEDMTLNDIASIRQNGCTMGSRKASEVMAEYGDDVVEWLDNRGHDLPALSTSWTQYACDVLSYAMVVWARDVCNFVRDIEDSCDVIGGPWGR